MTQWNFCVLRPGDKAREPVQGEFFATEAIRDLAEVLVRESIQNSLDAGLADRKVRVRFLLKDTSTESPAQNRDEYFEGLWPHVKACSTDIRTLVTQKSRQRFLVVEDFNTSGLGGDPEAHYADDADKNDFYYFFRAEGRSGKSAKDRGRWGLGKYVFVAASGVGAFFGLTVRAEDKKSLLMGQSVLRTHKLGTTVFNPDGWFGIPRSDGLVLPESNKSSITRFTESFGVERTTEPGLSTIVPYCSSEITEDNLIAAVIRQFFFPVITSALEVEVHGASGRVVLNDGTLHKLLQDARFTDLEEMGPIIELASWYWDSVGQQLPTCLPVPTDPPKWTNLVIPQEVLSSIKSSLQSTGHAVVRVPVCVTPKKGPTSKSHFDIVLLRRPKLGSKKPIFIREGLIVPDVRASQVRDMIALVVVDDKPLATLLGDSENPAHTEWQERSPKFKDKYDHGASCLRFVKHSVRDLLRAVTSEEEQEDLELLADIFSLPDEDEPIVEPGPGKKPGTESPVPTPPGRKPRAFSISGVEGGFRIRGTGAVPPSPSGLDVTVAYDVRRGGPFSRYQEADFDLGSGGLDKEAVGCAIVTAAGNRMHLVAQAPDFVVTVRGFDVRRDVRVKVVSRSAPNAENP